MTDDELDRRLRQALSVGPAADLPARIRARVAEEPARAPRWPLVPVTVGGLAVVGVVALMLVDVVPTREAPLTTTAVAPLADSAPVESPGALDTDPVALPTGVAASDQVATSTRGGGRSRPSPIRSVPLGEPPSLEPRLAPGDAEAFRVLLAFSRAAIAGAEPGHVVLAAAQPDAAEADEFPVLMSLEVAPLEVAPLVVTTVLDGGPQ